MKLKHWQGYGCITAKKISKKNKNGITTLVARVNGNHEWGIYTVDKYRIGDWLVKRFDRDFTDPYSIISIDANESVENNEDVCEYTITYPTPPHKS